MKPILFNTEMVRAILDGRKTCTRRVVKVPPYYPNFYKLHDNADGAITGPRDRLYAGFYNDKSIFYVDGEKHIDAVYYRAPYKPGDILYVWETWQHIPCIDCLEGAMGQCNFKPVTYEDKYSISDGCFVYRADYPDTKRIAWRPSIHMPKEAARIFLRVTDVRVERLRDITGRGLIDEGLFSFRELLHGNMGNKFDKYGNLWDSTIKPADRDQYGWDSDPWVWVIEFERISKEAALSGEGGDA